MKKIIEEVPEGIRYLKEWKEFSIPNEVSILNKQITGCGFTEFCLTNDEDVILCSPRKILLEDKEQQHKGEVYYIRNNYEKEARVDDDISSDRPNMENTEEDQDEEEEIEESIDFDNLPDKIRDMYKSIRDSYKECQKLNRPCKILVTYDSFRHVRWVLNKLHVLYKFRIVIDEFQSIFTDSKFKSSTELEFLNHLRGIKKVCYVSATPMIEEYLDMLEEFKDLPYYELDWESKDPGRVINPKIVAKQYTKGITTIVKDIVDSYRDENYDSAIVEIDGIKTKVESREAVFYVNSVKNICDIIKKCKLTLNETNILCARTDKNERQLKKAFKVGKKVNVFGEVPNKGEVHKKFTLCTRTVYLGADFYSTNAKSYIFSDANIDSLAVDISLDLPQILGRQRLEINPWKNRAELYYKMTREDNIKSGAEFKAYMENKVRKTQNLLLSYSTTPDLAKHDLAEKYQNDARNSKYKLDYVAVDKHAGSDIKPVFNNLVMVAEMRAFQIQQVDYRDRFRLFSSIDKTNVEYDNDVMDIVKQAELLPYFNQKMRYLYCLDMPEELAKKVFDNLLDTNLAKYYYSISKEKAGTLHYQKGELEKEYNRVSLISSTVQVEKLTNEIYSNFLVGMKYPKSYIKEKLKEIYDKLGYSKTAKANDIEEYFETKTCKVVDSLSGKRDNGFELIKKR